jgi:hemerythrin-like domain-containing protein
MKITERLKAEHGILLLLLDHLDAVLRRRAGREALQATVDAIAAAEEEHALIEDKLLFGLLAESLHPECPALAALREDHRQIGHLAQQVRLGVFDEDMVRGYSNGLRQHIERETHYFFPLVEELVAEDSLAKFGNWDEEHVLRTVRRGASAELWLG